MDQAIFGIDGGGTGTRLRIESADGQVLATAESTALNPRSNSIDRVSTVLHELFGKALVTAGLTMGELSTGFIGCAGADRPSEKSLLEDIMRRSLGFTGKLGLGNDAETALAGGLPDGFGIILIAGTGSIAWAKSASGRIQRCGGWGHLLGDEGSAWWIAREALSRAIHIHEGRLAAPDPTGQAGREILAAFLETWKLASPGELIPLVYGDFDKSRIAAGARIVESLRERGNRLAGEIFAEAATDLAALAVSVAGAMDVPASGLLLHGGLFAGNRWLRETCSSDLSARGFSVHGPGSDAALGACRLARSLV